MRAVLAYAEGRHTRRRASTGEAAREDPPEADEDPEEEGGDQVPEQDSEELAQAALAQAVLAEVEAEAERQLLEDARTIRRYSAGDKAVSERDAWRAKARIQFGIAHPDATNGGADATGGNDVVNENEDEKEQVDPALVERVAEALEALKERREEQSGTQAAEPVTQGWQRAPMPFERFRSLPIEEQDRTPPEERRRIYEAYWRYH
jgi:hypothetical protein